MKMLELKKLAGGKVVPVKIPVPDWAMEGLENLDEEERLMVVLFRLWREGTDLESQVNELKAEIAGGYYGLESEDMRIKAYEMTKESANLRGLFLDIVKGGNYMYDITGFMRDVLDETPFK